MKSLIIYGSQYGTTKYYAKILSQKTGISLINYKDIHDLSHYQTIIHIGALYAGGIMGLKKTIKSIDSCTHIIIITVGLADVQDQTNIENIRHSLSQQLPKEIYDKADIFHLRGGIDYKKLNFAHKAMMRLLYNKVKNIPDEKKTAEQLAMVETYNKKVSFIDALALNPIIECIEQYKNVKS
ncbi:MAG: flavodoxin domain-containing protein [Faecalibacillus sp.]